MKRLEKSVQYLILLLELTAVPFPDQAYELNKREHFVQAGPCHTGTTGEM